MKMMTENITKEQIDKMFREKFLNLPNSKVTENDWECSRLVRATLTEDWLPKIEFQTVDIKDDVIAVRIAPTFILEEGAVPVRQKLKCLSEELLSCMPGAKSRSMFFFKAFSKNRSEGTSVYPVLECLLKNRQMDEF